MATDTSVNNLVINVLSKQQFDSIAQKSDTELYLVPDVYDTVPTSGSTNPVTSNGIYNAVYNPIINHGTSSTTLALTPGVLHIWGEVSSLTLSLATPIDNTILNEYMFQFESGTTPTTLALPATILWESTKGELVPKSDCLYQVSIVDNIAIWIEVNINTE